jgi:copper homeostasis protein
LFELCADSLDAALAAQAGGADRMELCEQLAVGGVTPSAGLLAAVMEAVTTPVHVLIRPRAGDFAYSAAEFAGMRAEIEQARAAGAAGIAVGVLLADGRVDVERTRELVELARPMQATFHRAFDVAGGVGYGLREALEDVIRTGADCLLTSGGSANVLEGATQIGELQRQAGDRLEVMAGGGLRLENLAEVVRRSGVTRLHGSLSRKARGAGLREQIERDLREAIWLLQQECLEPAG